MGAVAPGPTCECAFVRILWSNEAQQTCRNNGQCLRYVHPVLIISGPTLFLCSGSVMLLLRCRAIYPLGGIYIIHATVVREVMRIIISQDSE